MTFGARMGVWILASGHRDGDEERLVAGRDRGRQERVGRLVRQILLAREEAHERSPLQRLAIANRSDEHRIARFDRVDDVPGGDVARDIHDDLALNMGERPEMRRKHHANHRIDWTSTERTGGRSRTIGVHVSPALADPYT